MPRVDFDRPRVELDGIELRTGDVLELLSVGARWIRGFLWMPGDDPPIPGPEWEPVTTPTFWVPLAAAGEEQDPPSDDWPDNQAAHAFRGYGKMSLLRSCWLRWVSPPRNIYAGRRFPVGCDNGVAWTEFRHDRMRFVIVILPDDTVRIYRKTDIGETGHDDVGRLTELDIEARWDRTRQRITSDRDPSFDEAATQAVRSCG